MAGAYSIPGTVTYRFKPRPARGSNGKIPEEKDAA